MDGGMVDPPERPDPHSADVSGETPDTPAGAGRDAEIDAEFEAELGGQQHDDEADRTGEIEIDDVDDAMRSSDGFDEIVGEIDYSDVDVPALLAEREEYKGLAQRIQADFDNYRKRSAVQSLAEADRASGRLAEALLPVLDAAEAAYLRHPEEVGPLLNQMLGELKKHGLETLDLEGKPFDPEYAEAVAHEQGEGGEPIVAEVLRSGYTWKGRILRAAMVKTKD